jgi:hypothetical protein
MRDGLVTANNMALVLGRTSACISWKLLQIGISYPFGFWHKKENWRRGCLYCGEETQLRRQFCEGGECSRLFIEDEHKRIAEDSERLNEPPAIKDDPMPCPYCEKPLRSGRRFHKACWLGASLVDRSERWRTVAGGLSANWPIKTIAKKAGISESGVKYIRRRIKANGFSNPVGKVRKKATA